MRRIVFVLFVVTTLQNAYSQDFELVRHQVQMGETVRMLSKKYKVEPAEIYRLNKFAIDGISKGMVLQILVEKKQSPVAAQQEPEVQASTENVVTTQQTTETPAESTTGIRHTVAKGETLYSLSKKYNVAVNDIQAMNEQALRKGMQTGQVLIIRPNN
jgi:LysM repeat protein